MNSKFKKLREINLKDIEEVSYGLRYKRLAENFCNIFDWQGIKCVVVVKDNYHLAKIENFCYKQNEATWICGTTNGYFLRKSTAIERAFQNWFQKVYNFLGIPKTEYDGLENFMNNLNKKEYEEDENLEIPAELIQVMVKKMNCNKCHESFRILDKYNHKCQINEDMIMIRCAICNNEMPNYVYKNHLNKCRSLKIIECQVCDENISLDELRSHQNKCSNNQPKCQICLALYKPEDQLVVLNCSHLVHKECIMEKKECFICDTAIIFPIQKASF